MVKKYRFLLLGIAATITLFGCGTAKNSDDTQSPAATSADDTAAESNTAPQSDTIEEDEEDESTVEELSPITPSDYLVENASEYATLSSYDGLAVTQYTYDITDDMVQEQIQLDREDAGTEDSIDTPSEIGDTVYLNLRSTVQGNSSESESEETYFTLGDEEYGAEFDQQLTGVSVGDTKKFSITFDDETWVESWMNQTVDFEVEITDVTRLSIPDYDDNFLTDYTHFTSKEDYESSIRTALEDEYLQNSYYDTVEELFGAALEKTAFNGYPQELYDSCREEVISSYSVFAGDDTENVAEILDAFGITDSDLDAETTDQVNRKLFISAYCQANDIEISEEEYDSYVLENAEYYDIPNPVEFEQMYTRDALVWSLYESKVADLLYQSAEITETAYNEDELFLDEEDADENDMDEFETNLDEIETGMNDTETNTEAETMNETEA